MGLLNPNAQFYGGSPVDTGPAMSALARAAEMRANAKGSVLKPLLGVLQQNRAATLQARAAEQQRLHEENLTKLRARLDSENNLAAFGRESTLRTSLAGASEAAAMEREEFRAKSDLEKAMAVERAETQRAMEVELERTRAKQAEERAKQQREANKNAAAVEIDKLFGGGKNSDAWIEVQVSPLEALGISSPQDLLDRNQDSLQFRGPDGKPDVAKATQLFKTLSKPEKARYLDESMYRDIVPVLQANFGKDVVDEVLAQRFGPRPGFPNGGLPSNRDDAIAEVGDRAMKFYGDVLGGPRRANVQADTELYPKGSAAPAPDKRYGVTSGALKKIGGMALDPQDMSALHSAVGMSGKLGVAQSAEGASDIFAGLAAGRPVEFDAAGDDVGAHALSQEAQPFADAINAVLERAVERGDERTVRDILQAIGGEGDTAAMLDAKSVMGDIQRTRGKKKAPAAQEPAQSQPAGAFDPRNPLRAARKYLGG